MLRSLLLATGLLLAAAAGPAGAADRWIHVAVDGTENDPERVRVNLPLELVETVLPLIEDAHLQDEDLLDEADLDREDLVAILRAVYEAEDGEYVTVEDGDETVRVHKEGGHLLVNVVEGEGEDAERVDIRFPMDVLAALLSSEEDDLDLVAAVHTLGEHGDGDLVTVNDSDGTRVRIWIDARNAPEPE